MKKIAILFIYVICLSGCSSKVFTGIQTPVALSNMEMEASETVITVGDTTLRDLVSCGFEILEISGSYTNIYRYGYWSLDNYVYGYYGRDETIYARLIKDGIVLYAGVRGQRQYLGDIVIFDLQWLPRNEGSADDAFIRVGTQKIKRGMTRDECIVIYGETDNFNLGDVYIFEGEGVYHELLYDDNGIIKNYIICINTP